MKIAALLGNDTAVGAQVGDGSRYLSTARRA